MRKFAHTNGDLVLTGDDNTPAMPMTEAEVNHLRLMLAWMRCEYMLDEDMQRGYARGLQFSAANGQAEIANVLLNQQVAKIKHVPAYVRQAVKMLTKALRDHEKERGIFDSQAERHQATDAQSHAPTGPETTNGDKP